MHGNDIVQLPILVQIAKPIIGRCVIYRLSVKIREVIRQCLYGYTWRNAEPRWVYTYNERLCLCICMLQAIANVNGIVKYELSLGVDHEAGRSLVNPSSWKEVEEFQVRVFHRSTRQLC